MEVSLSMLESLAEIVSASWRDVSPLVQRPLSVAQKDDRSPVTDVDIRLSELLIDRLQAWSTIRVISEEHLLPHEERARLAFYWLIDPIDGTKDFIAGTGDFSINVALMNANTPIASAMMIPDRDIMYTGAPGLGLWKNGISITRVATPLSNPPSVALSRFHEGSATEALLARAGITKIQRVGSAYKLALVAEGSVDLYPRLAPTHEWDIAAGHCLLKAAGCSVENATTGHELVYGSPDYLLPPFVAGMREAISHLRHHLLEQAAVRE